MSPLYLSDAGAALVFWTLFFGRAVIEAVNWSRLSDAGGASGRDHGSKLFLVATYWLGVGLGFVAAIGARFATIPWDRHLIFYVGIALLVAGVAVRQWAIATLGLFHTLDVTTRPDQPVIDDGPYRWMRHPSYSGAMLTAIGILLCATNWLALCCFVIVALGYAYRIRVEEKALAADLGPPYHEYASRTKRLIPFVI